LALDANKSIISTNLASWLTSSMPLDIITTGVSGVSLSLAQSIQITASPTFANLTLSGLSGLRLISTTAGGQLESTNITSWLGGTANQVTVTAGGGGATLSLPQNINSSAAVTFGSMTLGTLSGVLKASTGAINGSATTADLPESGVINIYFSNARARSALSATSPIAYNSTTGDISLDPLGSITVSNITDSGLTASRLVGSDGSKMLVSVNANSYITGTAHQITVSADVNGKALLSTPQDIDVSSAVTFASITDSGLTASKLLGTDGSKTLTSVNASSFISGTANQITVTGTTGVVLSLSLIHI
jgi:hypothetical protein